MNILMPSAGRRYKHIKFLKECQEVEKVITTDIDFLSPGIHAADKCYKVPRTTDEDYLPTIEKICKIENIDIIVPLLDLDILTFSRNREKFEDQNIKFLLSPKETIEIALDKLETAKFFSSNGLPAPQTLLPTQWSKEILTYPFLIKPRFPSLRVKEGYDISVIKNLSFITTFLPVSLGEQLLNSHAHLPISARQPTQRARSFVPGGS